MLTSLLGDRKKMIGDIVTDMKRPGKERKEKGYNLQEVSNEEAENGTYGEYHAFAEEMMEAFEKKDTAKLGSVLSAFASKFEPSHPGMDGEMEGAEY